MAGSFRDVLAVRYYSDDGAAAVTMERYAAEQRRHLDRDRGLEEHLPGQLPCDVTVTELRAMVIIGLPRELAARVSSGPAFSLGRGGLALPKLADGLAGEILADTILGPL